MEKEKNVIIKEDGWMNFLSAVGRVNKDKSSANYFDAPIYDIFTDDMLTRIYIHEGIGRKIISRPADDMTRTWFEIENDENDVIQEELKRLKAHAAINYAIKMARLYRGSVIVMLFDGDTSELSKPAPKSIRGIKSLRVYSAARIDLTTSDIVDDFNSEYFDEVEIFTIRKKNGQQMRVHASRCLVFKGEETPDGDAAELNFKFRYWGTPVLMGVWDRLSNYGVVEKGICTLMQECAIGKYKMANLIQMLSQNTEANLKQIYTRMEVINAAKSIVNAVFLGEGEDYTRDSINFAGIPDIIDRMMMNLSAVCNIPVAILFGRSAAGLNATGDADFQGYYDMISSAQDTWLIHPVKKLVETIALYKKISNPKIEFNPLEEANEKEVAEIRKLNTESDKMDYDMGLYDSRGILENRGVEVDDLPEIEEEIEE